MDYKDIANRLRKWANGETCEDCPAKDDLAFCAADTIRELLSKVEELEARNKRLDESRENANAACAKWEGLYRAELEKKAGKAAWIRVEDRLPERFCPVIVCRKDGKVEAGQKDVGDWWRVYGTRIKTVSYWMPLPEPPKEV